MIAQTALAFHTPAIAGKLTTNLRGSVATWTVAWREARAAEECGAALAQTRTPRAARARNVFEACYASAGTRTIQE